MMLEGKFYPDIPDVATYQKDFMWGKEPDKTELIHFIILCNKFKLRVDKACIMNENREGFDRALNSFKSNLDEQEIELLTKYATYLYENLINDLVGKENP